MKKTLVLLFIIGACIAGFLSIRGTMPFMPVFGTSMEPELHTGNLILIGSADPTAVKVGDIIIFTIPEAVREHYNYPPVIAHRVKTVITEPRLVFRTKGDNTGEDPFSVRPEDLKGMVGKQIPYLGLPLLFFQSQQGLIFIVVALSLLTLYLYSSDISRGRQTVQRGIFAPVIEESRRSSRVIAQRMETTEKGMESTQQALQSFASAIAEYAEHLKSHTSAIQSLSEASLELKRGAAEQNIVLGRIAEVMERPAPKMVEPQPRVEEADKVVLKLEKVEEVIHKLEHKLDKVEKIEKVEGVAHEVVHKIVPKVEKIVYEAERIQFPPGCVRNRPRPVKDKEILRAG